MNELGHNLLGTNHLAVTLAMVMVFFIGTVSAARVITLLVIDPLADIVNFFRGVPGRRKLVMYIPVTNQREYQDRINFRKLEDTRGN